jgi:hypothetical protein
MSARRCIVVVLAVLFGVPGTAGRAAADAAPEPFGSTTAPAIDSGVDAALAASGTARVIVTYRRVPKGLSALGGVKRVLDGGRVVARIVGAADVGAMRGDPDVAAVVIDQLRDVEEYPDAGWEHQPNHLQSVAVGSPGDGSGQVVAVLDTGVLAGHVYFTNNGTTPTRVLPGACFATSDTGGGDCPNGQTTQFGAGAGQPCAASCDHGTHVAGIVAGRDDDVFGIALRGVAPGAQVLPIRVFHATAGNPQAFDSDVLAGLYYVYEQRGAYPLAAVNMSLGGGHSTTACDADPSMGLYVDVITRLRASGIATTIAAGNTFSSNSVAFPACVAAGITVSATTSTLTGTESIADFSDRLAGLTDFAAPGARIVSSVADGGFAYEDGTSMAAPMIAGAFASIRSALVVLPRNQAGFDAIVNGLNQSATAVMDAQGHVFGRPRVQTAITDTIPPVDPTQTNDPPPITGRFVPVTPDRLVDTRMGAGQRVPANAVRFYDFDDSEVLPSGASAVALNVTVVGPAKGGFLTVFPCVAGSPNAKAPDTSNVNFDAGRTVANLVVVGLSASGQVCFTGNADMDVIVDLMGWYGGTGAGAFGPVTPARALDTRPTGTIGARQVVAIPIGGRFGVPTDAVAAVLNVTATDAAADGFVTVFPCASGPPDTSNVNFVAGRAVPNQVLVGLTNGQVCITTDKPTNVLVDVTGYYAAPPQGTSRFTPIAPGRLTDTRFSAKPAARSIVVVPALGQRGVPSVATAVALNVTVDGATGLGFFTVFPCATAPPDASSLNYVAGLTVANSVTVGVGQGGAVCVYTEASANVLVDVTGYYGP